MPAALAKYAIKPGEHRSPTTQFKPGDTAGEKNAKWVGDRVSYFALHGWVARNKEKAGRCTDCGVYSDTVWANTNYEYRRNLDDFVELCVKCHHEKDRNSGRWGDATRQFNLGVPGKSGRREST